MVDVAKLAIEVDSSQAVAAAKNLDGLSASAVKTTSTTGKMDDANKKTAHSARMMAMQLSQVASQGSVTGNYLQALAIQIPDLALAFGTGAIIVGSLAGALAGPLITALMGSTKSVSDLSDVVGGLNGNFDEAADGSYKFSEELVRLAKVSKAVANLKIEVETEKARRAVLDIGSALRETFLELTGDQTLSALDKLEGLTIGDKIAEELGVTADEARILQSALAGAVQSTNPEDYNNLANVLTGLSEKYNNNYGSVKTLTSGMLETVIAGAEAAQTFNRMSEASKNLDELLIKSGSTADDVATRFSGLETEIDKTAYSLDDWYREQGQAQRKYNSIITGLVESRFTDEEAAAQKLGETMQQVQALRDQDLITNDQYLAAKAAAEQNYADDVAMINQRKIENDRATLQTYSDVLGTMAQVAQQGGKEQFDAYKALASAQALIATYLAATRALSEVPYPLNFVAAGVVSAAGAVQVAQIQSQEYQGSYLGGGYTGQGSRTGGIDGMGGFPAILHPDETVIDHRLSGGSGGGMQANITVNNNASGATASVRRIDDANFIIDVISADAAKGGRGSKAIAGAYGLRRAAR